MTPGESRRFSKQVLVGDDARLERRL